MKLTFFTIAVLWALPQMKLASSPWKNWINENIQTITSVEYTQTKSLVRKDLAEMYWSEKKVADCGSLYDLAYLSYDHEGNLLTEHRECLTAEHFMVLDVRDAFLHLYKPAPRSHDFLANESYLYSVFEFILDDLDRSKFFESLRIKNIRKAASQLNSKLKNADPNEKFFFGGKLHYFTVSAGIHPKYKSEAQYEVFYSSSTGEIFGWNLLVKHKQEYKIVASLHVNEVGSATVGSGAIWYPREFKKYFYGWDLNKLSESPTHYLYYRTKQIHFNKIKEDDIGIDPSVARVIRDEEKRVNVFVPQ